MIRPSRFNSNPETESSNQFQASKPKLVPVSELALKEFDACLQTLLESNLDVCIFDDASEQVSPDSVFPNNWISFHEDLVVLYAMESELRRREKRTDLLEALGQNEKRLLDFSGLEREGLFLEGTGSLVLDRTRNIAYAALSSRTHKKALEFFSKETGFKVQAFHCVDLESQPIYHTNVMMSLGVGCAVIYLDGIKEAAERGQIEKSLQASGREMIQLSFEQVKNFCGNILRVNNKEGKAFWLCSQTAFDHFSPGQKKTLEREATLLPVKVPTIEQYGGGSIRCMIAEIF